MHAVPADVPGGVGDPGDAPRRRPRSGGGTGLIRPGALAVLLHRLGIAASVKIALANTLLLAAAAAWWGALRRGEARRPQAGIHRPVLAYVGASVLAAAFSLDPAHSVLELGDLATLVLIPMTVSLLDLERWDRLLRLLAAVAAASSAVGVWQYLHGADDLAHRLSGLTTHYMTFSGWTVVVVLLLLADAAFHPDRRRLLWTVPTVGLCTAALLLSYTRNAWIGLGLGLVLMAAVWRPRALVLYPFAAAALVLVLPAPVLERAVSIVDLRQPANYDRLCMVVSGVQMIQDHPFTGVGPGMVERRYPVYRRDDAPRWRVPHLHDNPLQIAAERGLLGLAAYLWILAAFARHTWHALRRAEGPAFAALAGCFLAVAGITAAGLFEYNWGDAEVWIVTLLALAAPYALAREAP